MKAPFKVKASFFKLMDSHVSCWINRGHGVVQTLSRFCLHIVTHRKELHDAHYSSTASYLLCWGGNGLNPCCSGVFTKFTSLVNEEDRGAASVSCSFLSNVPSYLSQVPSVSISLMKKRHFSTSSLGGFSALPPD